MATEDLVTVAEARAALRLGREDLALQPELERLITSATRLIDQHFGAMVVRTVTSELHNDPVVPYLHLRQGPISSVTSVSVDGVALTSGQYQVVQGGYQEMLCRVASYQPTLWLSRRLQGISVTYVAGRYATTSAVPAIVKDACMVQLRHLWRPTQHGVTSADVNEYDTAAVAPTSAGLARGLKGMLGEFLRHGVA